MKNTKYITQLLESKGLTVTITEEVLGKEGYTTELNDKEQKVGQWVGIEAKGTICGIERQVNAVVYQDIAKGTDKIESGFYTVHNVEQPIGRGTYKWSDLELLLR